MADVRVTSYVIDMDFANPDEPTQLIILYKVSTEIGTVICTNPAIFSATIDVLRNEGPNIFWDENRKVLSCGLEPIGEGEG